MNNDKPMTIGALKAANFQILPIREEMRLNLVNAIKNGETVFPGIVGYDETVIPQIENAILAGQDIILLGERGQAKTRIIRSLTRLLNEWTPVIAGVEIPENPLAPISAQAKALIAEKGDETPIRWMHRDERFGEKLATPDITIADLIGEVDPIKIAEGRYLSDELTLHYGLVPKTNRGIFAINELPDLSERIQVGLLNLMEERDVQIRGHKVRLALDMLVVATANPEDYTNRGRIITPLKDRYGAQIRTHYPQNIEHEISVMEAEKQDMILEGFTLNVPDYMQEIIAEISMSARQSADVNQASGVSVRTSISNYECMIANAMRRTLRLRETEVVPRISDLPFVIPALQGKVEFEVLDDGQEEEVIALLLESAIDRVFRRCFDLESLKGISDVFQDNVSVDTGEVLHAGFYEEALTRIDGLAAAVDSLGDVNSPNEKAAAVEFILEGMHLNQMLNKDQLTGNTVYHG